MHFGRDFGTKINEKSMPKRCQKHVGIDLEVEPAKTQKMTPLTAFLMFFLIKLGPKSIKNPWKIDPKVRSFPIKFLDRFLVDFWWIWEPFWEPGWSQNRYKKVLEKWWKNDDDKDGDKVENGRLWVGKRGDVEGGGYPRGRDLGRGKEM